jgi:hypothetical protein
MALKSARAGGLDTGDGVANAYEWLRQAWEAANAKTLDAAGAGSFPASWSIATRAAQGQETAAGAWCMILCGAKAGDRMLDSLVTTILAKRPDPAQGLPTNLQEIFFANHVIFQAGGDKWGTWNPPLRDLIIQTQRKDACFDGSWDAQGQIWPGHERGRLASSAFAVLCLEVYYYHYRPTPAPR